MIVIQIVLSALTCVPIMKLGHTLGSPRAGQLAAWTWACYPYFVMLPVLFVWETTLSAFLLSWLLLITARLLHRDRWPQWVLYGAAWATAALTNTALLAIIPVCFGWLWWQKRRVRDGNWLSGAAVTALVVALLVAPWCWRNWRVFHTFVPVRSNFGEELWLGNHEGGRGRLDYGENAYENSRELDRFQQLGEIAYVHAKREAALHFITTRRGQFIRNVLYRVLYWWFGVGEQVPIFWLYAALGLASITGVVVVLCSGAGRWYLVAFSVAFFPLTYYVADVMARYRHPIEPAMVLASAYCLDWALERPIRLRRRFVQAK